MLTPRFMAIASFLIIALLQAGCFDLFSRHELGNITESQVIGDWRLTLDSAKRFLVYPIPSNTKSTAQFFADNRCVLNNFFCDGLLYSGEGTWKIEKEGSSVSALYISGFYGAERPVILSCYFTLIHGKLILWENWGETDYIDYERS
jgi:hypothetical protein